MINWDTIKEKCINLYNKYYLTVEQVPMFVFVFKWFFITFAVGAIVGSASAWLLITLSYVTGVRDVVPWVIWLLPLGGFGIGLLYHYLGYNVVKGNNYLIDELHEPSNIVPFRMVPLIFVSNVITILFGGSVGREGTAVQMGGAFADQLSYIFKKPTDRKIMLCVGISAGFASVFGTPLAGAIFALEVIVLGRLRYDAIVPSFMAAIFAHIFCLMWSPPHLYMAIVDVPDLNGINMLHTIIMGAFCGVVAFLFVYSRHIFAVLAKRFIIFPPLRPLIGGVIIVVALWIIGTNYKHDFIGLGLDTITDSFTHKQEWFVFVGKLLFTAFALGLGFKGGEVTPLFFIGAAMGSFVSGFIPLPMSLLAAMGFVAVFAGGANTPIACTLMGLELFGAKAGVFIGLACVISYLFSAHTGIYSSQIIGSPKNDLYSNLKGKHVKW